MGGSTMDTDTIIVHEAGHLVVGALNASLYNDIDNGAKSIKEGIADALSYLQLGKTTIANRDLTTKAVMIDDYTTTGPPHVLGRIIGHAIYHLVQDSSLSRQDVLELLVKAIPNLQAGSMISDEEYFDDVRQKLKDQAATGDKQAVDDAFGEVGVGPSAPAPVAQCSASFDECSGGYPIWNITVTNGTVGVTTDYDLDVRDDTTQSWDPFLNATEPSCDLHDPLPNHTNYMRAILTDLNGKSDQCEISYYATQECL